MVGANAETDAELKLRRTQELNLAGVATVEAIKSRLSARADVEAVEVFQNTAAIEINGRPPHSVEVLIKGGDEAALATALFNLVGAGITYFGSVTRQITDSQGHQQTIRFSRPVEVPVFVEFTLSVTADYPADGDDRVKAAILAWGADAVIGRSVILLGSNALACVIDDIPGITSLGMKVGRAADELKNENLQIEPSELPTFDEANITIIKE